MNQVALPKARRELMRSVPSSETWRFDVWSWAELPSRYALPHRSGCDLILLTVAGGQDRIG